MAFLSAPLPALLGGEGITTLPVPGPIQADTVRDFLSDPVTEELVVRNGDLVLVSGIDSIAQDIRKALKFFQGEFFGDQTVGTPYFQRILGVKGKGLPDIASIREVIRQRILGRLGVTGIVSLDVTRNTSLRSINVTAQVQATLGLINVNTIIGVTT